MLQNIFDYFFAYDLSKTPGFLYALANFLGVIVYTASNPRRRTEKDAYRKLMFLELVYVAYNFFTRNIPELFFYSKHSRRIFIDLYNDLCSL